MADFQVTGNIRIPNAAAILVRDQNDNSDFTALATDASANLLIGHASMPNIFFVAGPIVHIPTRLELADGARLAWGSGGDVSLWRDGQWELGLRDGLNDMFFYIYGTFTDASNYERLALYAGSSVLHIIEPQSAGTGNNTINLAIRALGGGSFTIGQADNGGSLHFRGPNTFYDAQSNNQQTQIKMASQVLTMSSGQTQTATNRIPAGAIVLGVTTRVETLVTGPATFSVGDGTDVDRWGTGLPVASASRSDATDWTTSALVVNNGGLGADIVVTSDGVDFTGGTIRVVVHYLNLIAPTI